MREARRAQRDGRSRHSLQRRQRTSPWTRAMRRFAWARGLTIMRQRQADEVAARVVVGGRLGPAGDGYRGRMPGVLEEALLTIRTERPVYLVGAFGGCARLVFDALEGRSRPELQWDHQKTAPYSEELRVIYQRRGESWDEYDAIADELKSRGIAGIKNGLTEDENRELAMTRSAERIVELILHGMQECNRPAMAGSAE